MIDKIANNLPEHIQVTVIMEKQPARSSQWVDYLWTAIGVIVSNTEKELHKPQDKPQVADTEDDVQLKLYSGYQVRLHVDECDSYYHNLMSPTPHCFIVVRQNDDDDEPVPFIVSLSFDEAHAYLEGGDEVFVVDIPPEIYQWTESFVLQNYCPQQLKKRKRRDWKEQVPVENRQKENGPKENGAGENGAKENGAGENGSRENGSRENSQEALNR